MIGSSTYGGDVVLERKVRVENYTQIFARCSGSETTSAKGDGGI